VPRVSLGFCSRSACSSEGTRRAPKPPTLFHVVAPSQRLGCLLSDALLVLLALWSSGRGRGAQAAGEEASLHGRERIRSIPLSPNRLGGKHARPFQGRFRLSRQHNAQVFRPAVETRHMTIDGRPHGGVVRDPRVQEATGQLALGGVEAIGRRGAHGIGDQDAFLRVVDVDNLVAVAHSPVVLRRLEAGVQGETGRGSRGCVR